MRSVTAARIGALLVLGLSLRGVEPIAISVYAVTGPPGFVANGTMPIAITISNASSSDLTLPGQFPRLSGLTLSVSGIPCKPENFHATYRQRIRSSLTIPMGSVFEQLVYLTDYYTFTEPGTARVVWALTLPASSDTPASPALSASGAFDVSIRAPDTRQAHQELDHLVALYGNAGSDLLRRPYLSGLCSVHDPIVIPYLSQLVVGPSEGQAEAIARLCSEWFDRDDARSVLDQYLLTGADGGLINLIVQEFVAHRRTLTEAEVTRLLDSTTTEICYAGLWYARHMLSALNVKALSGVAAGPNPQLANEAQAIIDSFAERENVSPNSPQPKTSVPKSPKPNF